MLQFVQSSNLLKSSVLSLACCLLTVNAAYADVYKYKDDKGNVLYTDKPMFLPAEKISIKTEASNIVDLNQPSDDKKPATANDAARKPAAPAKPKSEDQGDKVGACEKARQDYLSRMNAQRLYEEQSNGERRYLTDKELDAARSSAKQAMETLCD